ncbi:hypothetical protein TNCV_165461, partial [Trichonephila clavipes]
MGEISAALYGTVWITQQEEKAQPHEDHSTFYTFRKYGKILPFFFWLLVARAYDVSMKGDFRFTVSASPLRGLLQVEQSFAFRKMAGVSQSSSHGLLFSSSRLWFKIENFINHDRSGPPPIVLRELGEFQEIFA